MLLTIDVGNTNITMGAFDGEFLPGMFRMTTKRQRTSDEYGMTICGILEHRGIDPKQIDAVIIASVVPDIMHSLTSGIIKYLHTTPMIVTPESDTGIRVNTENPSRTGPDRIVNAVAMGRGRHAARDPDREAGYHPGEGYYRGDAGRACVRRDRPDRIYRTEDERGVRVCGCICHSYGRSREDHRQRDRVY